jgi:hypothetical protein
VDQVAVNFSQGKDLLTAHRDRSAAELLSPCKKGKCRAIIDSGTSLITMPTGLYVHFLQTIEKAMDLDTCKVKEEYSLADMSLEFDFGGGKWF